MHDDEVGAEMALDQRARELRERPFAPEQVAHWKTVLRQVKPDLAATVKWRREELGWSQARLAAELESSVGLKLDPSAITRIEQARRDVRADELWALAVVLREPLGSLIHHATEVLAAEELLEFEQSRLEVMERGLRSREQELEEQRAVVRRLRRAVRNESD